MYCSQMHSRSIETPLSINILIASQLLKRISTNATPTAAAIRPPTYITVAPATQVRLCQPVCIGSSPTKHCDVFAGYFIAGQISKFKLEIPRSCVRPLGPNKAPRSQCRCTKQRSAPQQAYVERGVRILAKGFKLRCWLLQTPLRRETYAARCFRTWLPPHEER